MTRGTSLCDDRDDEIAISNSSAATSQQRSVTGSSAPRRLDILIFSIEFELHVNISLVCGMK